MVYRLEGELVAKMRAIEYRQDGMNEQRASKQDSVGNMKVGFDSTNFKKRII